MSTIKLSCPCGATIEASPTHDTTIKDLFFFWNERHKDHSTKEEPYREIDIDIFRKLGQDRAQYEEPKRGTDS